MIWIFTPAGDETVSSPTIKELAIFPSLGDTWKDLGAALSIDEETLQSINKKFSNLVKKQKELFRAYLKSNPNPTWSDIIDALVKIGKDDIARKVVDTFNLSPEIHSSKKLDHRPFDSSQPQTTKHCPVSDGEFEETDNYFPVVERSSESLPSVNKGKLKSIPTPFSSDPIKDKDGRSSISGSDRELSFRKESETSSPEENSSSSDDFHSAEEMPLDTRATKSDKNQQFVFGSHVSHTVLVYEGR